MGKTHVEQLKLKQLLTDIQRDITIGARYVHYKGADKIYEVTDIAFMEANNTPCVIYKALYGEQLTFIRPVSSWIESVEWQGTTVPRFTKL